MYLKGKKKTIDKFLSLKQNFPIYLMFSNCDINQNIPNGIFVRTPSIISVFDLASLESLQIHMDIVFRFAKVFDLTYTRFNDLKQAEAQAREAKIEAALERVRAKAMAMHKS